MPRPTTTKERNTLLIKLSDIVHHDFEGCNGSGSVFCVGCIALRSIHALVEVYEELDEQNDIEGIADRIIDRYKGGDPDVENITTIH